MNDEKLSAKAEIDIVMTNCDYLLLIETKYRLDEQNENVFDNKIRALKEYEPQAVEDKKTPQKQSTIDKINTLMQRKINR